MLNRYDVRTWLRRHAGPSEGLRSKLIHAVAGTFMLNLLQKALMLGVTVLLARDLGPHDYGIYASAMAAVVLLSYPMSLGLPNLIVREVATFHLREKWGLMRGLLGRSAQLMLLGCLLLAAALYFYQGRLVSHGQYTTMLLWTAFALLPLTLLGTLRNMTLRGLHHVALGMVPETVVVPIVFLASIVVVHVEVPCKLDPAMVMLLRLVAVAIAFVVGCFYLWRRQPPEVWRTSPEYRTRAWLGAAAPMLWVGAMTVITTQTDVLMLAALRGPADAGTYQVAARGAELVALVPNIGAMALQPTLARLFAAGDMQRLKRLVRHMTRFMLVAALIMVVGNLCIGRELMRDIFGSAYGEATPALLILSIGWLMIAMAGPARDTLLMIGGERQSAISISIAATVNIVLNFVLIPVYGTVGAALATAISLTLCHWSYAWSVWRKVKVRTGIL